MNRRRPQTSTAPTPSRMIQSMPTERVRKLLAEAAGLPEEERAELVNELARTLPEEYAHSVDYDELDCRMQSVRDGTATLVPWEEARKQLLPDG